MRCEIRADQTTVKRPVVLGVSRGVDPDKAVASLDVALEGSLLIGLQNVAGGQQEDDRTVACEGGVGEDARIFGRVDYKSMLIAKCADGIDRVRDRFVAETCGPREDQHAVACLRLLRASASDDALVQQRMAERQRRNPRK